MKTLIFILTFGLIACRSNAQTTNTIPPNLFLTDDGFLFSYGRNGRVVDVSRIEAAKKSAESRPADQDTEGHWGFATNGLQLSLRLEKKSYAVGEPIVATMIMRNVSEKVQKHYRPIYVKVLKDGKLLKRKDDDGVREITISPEITLFPQTQHRYQEKLEQVFNLNEAGEYIFQAECIDPEVTSQSVSITVTNSAAK